MPGFGPPAGHPDAAPAAATVDRDAAASLYQQAAADATTDPQRGYAMGHDVAYGANTENRQFVHAIRAGWEAGLDAKAQVCGQAREADAAKGREARAAREAQRELEAG